MKFDECYNRLLKKTTRNLVFEDVFFDDTFSGLIDYIDSELSMKPICYVKHEDLERLIPKAWKLKRKIDPRKTVAIVLEKDIKELDLERSEKHDIRERLEKDDACFTYELQKPMLSVIAINDNLPWVEFRDALFHELIHFFQWSTGESLHKMKKSQKSPSIEDFNAMSNAMHVENNEIEELVKYVMDKGEREPFYNEIYKFCKKNNLAKDRVHLKWFIESFLDEDSQTFEDYLAKLRKRIEKYKIDLSSKATKILMIYGFYKVGFTSLKNHILSYFDKEEQLSK